MNIMTNNDFLRMSKANYSNNSLITFFNQLKKIIEKNDLNQFRLFLTQNKFPSKSGFLELILFYLIKDSNNFYPSYISVLISLGLDPNIIIDDLHLKIFTKNADSLPPGYPKGKSILMLACEKSSFDLVKDLCENNINKNNCINVNYIDKYGRNCLFYLKGGENDSEIIEYLVNKGIEVNRRDKDENSVLSHLVINTDSIKLIYDFINIASPIFTIKNKQGKNSLELINEKKILRRNHDNIINVANFDDIKNLINLIKAKLSIKQFPSNKIYEIQNSSSNNNNTNNNNLIKLSSLTTSNTEENINQPFSSNNINNQSHNYNHNMYIKVPRLSLIIDTEFYDNDDISSTTKKIDYYAQMNKNKKYLLNLLKKAEHILVENSKDIQELIIEKKKELKILKEKMEKKKINLSQPNKDFDIKIDSLKSNLNKNQNKIDQKKQNLITENPDTFINITKDQFLYKYAKTLNRDINKENIYSQLKIDLIDFMNYVQKRNSKLETTVQKINALIQESVSNCLGDGYNLQMYGSRATKLCLPWSDIDYVISYTKNEYMDPLRKLYDYLYTIPDRFFLDMKYISGASVPVLKIFTTEEYNKISLDISMENPEHHGEECVNYIKEKKNKYEVLTPITFALKTILQKASLNDPYKGGLSSYGVILLVLNFLKNQEKMGNDISMKNLGKLFYNILYYYGFEYDMIYPIIIGDNIDYQKINLFHQFQINRSEFILVDPLNIANNVAKNTRQAQNIKLAFKIGYISFLESCECGCHYQYDGLNIKEENCEHNLLIRIFNDVKRD